MALEVQHIQGAVLITGGMGNIGKYIVREMLHQGYKVIVMDVQDLTEDLKEVLREKGIDEGILDGPAFHYHKGDIRDMNGITGLLTDRAQALRGIIHLAAISRVAFCLDNEVDCMDVNVRGTAALLDAVEHHLRKHPGNGKPWMVFTSSREIYGSNCGVSTPCSEESVPAPLNLYGETKWQGEQAIRSRSLKLLRGHIMLRLASVYGGLFDLSERLIPAVTVRCMTNNPVELNGGDQIFDFVYMEDVIASLIKAVARLETSLNTPVSEEYLICSGEHTTARQVLGYIRDLTSSRSALHIKPADTRYPTTFVCDNSKMRYVLGHYPLYPGIEAGLATYLRSIFDRDSRLLVRSYDESCSIESASRVLDSALLQDCSVYITVLEEGPNYLKHLSYPEPTSRDSVGTGVHVRSCGSSSGPRKPCFTLQYEGEPYNFITYNGSRIFFEAVFEPKSGGYILQGAIGSDGPYVLVLGGDLNMQIGGLTKSPRVSIWPYSCPPDAVSKKARLPTILHEPIWYLLHEIILPEDHLPRLPEQPLVCRRLQAAIDHTRQRASRCATGIVADLSARELGPDLGFTQSPLCDSNCDLVGGCVNTGVCRCVTPMCGLEISRNSPFPFHAFAFTNTTSFGAPALEHLTARDRIAKLPYRSILKMPAAHYATTWDPPKVHVLSIDVASLFDRPLDDRATTISQIPYASCFTADHFLSIGSGHPNTSLSEADFVLIPFYGGWLRHYMALNNTVIANGLSDLILQTQTKIQALTQKQPRLLVPLTHDYGAAFDFSYDMRNFRGTALPQLPSLRDVTVLSPFGDFNTLAYQPHKDIVIPPVTCRTPLLLETFRDVSLVKLSSDRDFLVYFGGAADDRTGSAVRSAFMSGTLFPNSNVKLGSVQDHREYMHVLNNSVFCPHLFGTTGWATRLPDSIYAGCIPILTSDVTHPPFWDVLDWSKFSVHVDWRQLEDIEETLKSFSSAELDEKQGWLMKVRDAFLYDPDVIDQEQDGQRKGPIFHSMLSLQAREAL